MKNLLKVTIGIALVLLTNLLPAQKISKEITLEDIYKKRVFSEKSVHGIRSMKDGEHFTTLEQSRKIVKKATKPAKPLIFCLIPLNRILIFRTILSLMMNQKFCWLLMLILFIAGRITPTTIFMI